MLSFDITDKKIRIIKGTESNGKIRISAAAEIALDEAVIVNGLVNDVNRVAVLINQVLKRNNMPDKEAIIALSSNQTVFKELLITPNPKESEFMKEIRQQLLQQINVDDSYSVAYVIVGDPEDDENGEKKQRVLVTACPYDYIDRYKRIFHMLGITLKSVMIGCNAITKVLLADAKIKAKMPLLAVQIDTDFISLNLYEDNQLSFSRFASIDPDDYNNPDDYVFEAVNENIFRMLQFARSRGSDNIENVVFYGDINASPNLYNRLIDDLAQNDLNVSQLNVPPQIHGYQNLEFSVYANAIGAMFKRNKLTEHINLLETESSGAVAGRVKSEKNVTALAIVGVGAALLCVLGTWGVLSVMDGAIKSETKKLRAQIESPDTAAKLQQYDDLQVMKEKVNSYNTEINNLSDAYKTLPIVESKYYEAIETALEEVTAQFDTVEEVPKIAEIDYSMGIYSFNIDVVTTDEYTQKFPAALIEYILTEQSDLFSQAEYTGYTVENTTVGGDEQGNGGTAAKSVPMTMVLTVNNDSNLPAVPAPEETEAETTEAAE